MAAWRYEISLLVLKNISLIRYAHSWNIVQHSKRNFVSPLGHVISSFDLTDFAWIVVLISGFQCILSFTQSRSQWKVREFFSFWWVATLLALFRVKIVLLISRNFLGWSLLKKWSVPQRLVFTFYGSWNLATLRLRCFKCSACCVIQIMQHNFTVTPHL